MAEKKNAVDADVMVDDMEEVEVDNDTIYLSKPMADGRETLTLDFTKINGRVLLNLSKTARKLDPTCTVMALSQFYQALVGAKAAGIKYDEALELPAKDFTALCVKAQNFLLL